MKAFALRDKETGLYLIWGRNKRGNSKAKFISALYPRLFNTKREAVNCKTAWKSGIWSHNYDGDSSLEPRFIKDRKEMNIEIVEFNLIEKEA